MVDDSAFYPFFQNSIYKLQQVNKTKIRPSFYSNLGNYTYPNNVKFVQTTEKIFERKHFKSNCEK